MRSFFIICWLAIPLLAWAYHVGPGQEQLKLDDAGRLLHQASLAGKAEDFDRAKTLYSESLAKLPSDRKADAYVARLELAKAQTKSGQLPEGRASLETLLEEMEKDQSVDPKVFDQTREALAGAQYYMTWLMRLEGKAAEEWEPEADAARQNYRLLSEKSAEAGDDKQLESHRHDLEATIRLARMDLDELQALKIPKQCNGCCSNQCKKPGKPSQKKSEKKGQGANTGPLPDGSGS
ncbi:MAG: hypothetical protein U0892_00245 [Pirellulales bacterium]